MDVNQHDIEKEKQKKNMKGKISKKISLCNELFLANRELCPKLEEILLKMNTKYYTGKNKYLLHTQNKQKLSLQDFCPSVAYKFNMISLHYNNAHVNVCILNAELNDFKINILAIINNVEPLLGLLLYSNEDNIEINKRDFINKSLKFMKSKSLKFMKKDNLYLKYKKYEENNARNYHLSHTAVMMRNFTTIFNKYYKMKIVKDMLFYVWLFQDIYVGYLVCAILKTKYLNIFNVLNIDKFAIIRIHQNSLLKLNFEFFTFDINNIFNLQIPVLNLHFPIVIMKAKWFKLDRNSKSDANSYFNNLKSQAYEKQDKSTFVFYKNQKSYFRESGINTEQNNYEMESESQIDINNVNYLTFINSTLWLPYLCGDCYDDKIGNISYILQCSCLNESLLDLDNIERYIREVTNILTSMKFYMTAFKDLTKYLAYIFLRL